jgi:hypothetical protein
MLCITVFKDGTILDDTAVAALCFILYVVFVPAPAAVIFFSAVCHTEHAVHTAGSYQIFFHILHSAPSPFPHIYASFGKSKRSPKRDSCMVPEHYFYVDAMRSEQLRQSGESCGAVTVSSVSPADKEMTQIYGIPGMICQSISDSNTGIHEYIRLVYGMDEVSHSFLQFRSIHLIIVLLVFYKLLVHRRQ